MPKPSYAIQRFRLTHYAEVARLWRRTEGVGLNESDTRANIAAYLRRNPGMSFVARSGRRLVGAVLCGHDGRRGYLHHLAVAPPNRRKGVARRLIDACLARLAADGITRCNLFLFTNHREGEAFWRHNGWAKREDLCVMQRPVPVNSRKGSSA